MLRFFQTGDWHLGQAYRQFDVDLADRLRAGRLEAIGRVLEEADRSGAAFVLAAGDQFDGPQPDPRLVRELLDRIGGSKSPVHMIPGNHDPHQPGSVYVREEFRKRPANLHYHDRARPVPLPGLDATLYPCPCTARYGDDPMAWIPPRAGGEGLRIALAHGSLPVQEGEAGGPNYPIAADAPRRFGLDYVALGDWHRPTPDPDARPDGRMYYAGAPEVGGWDETGAGFALEVTLEAGADPAVARRRVGRHAWSDLSPGLFSVDDVRRLVAGLGEDASSDRIVRVTPTGGLPLAARAELESAVEGLRGRFASLILDLSGLRMVADGDVDLPLDSILREAHRRLLRLADDPADGVPKRFPGELPAPDAEVIARAMGRFRGLLH